jgi:hypothetical protein
MGVANSNNAATDGVLTSFFGIFTSGNSPDTMVQNLVALFCPNDAAPPATTIPCVGITSHATRSPTFLGTGEIRSLFTRFFKSFPDLSFTPLGGVPRLYSPDSYAGLQTIGVQVTLSGTFTNPWFQKDHGKKDKDSHYSKPLSDIQPVTATSWRLR